MPFCVQADVIACARAIAEAGDAESVEGDATGFVLRLVMLWKWEWSIQFCVWVEARCLAKKK